MLRFFLRNKKAVKNRAIPAIPPITAPAIVPFGTTAWFIAAGNIGVVVGFAEEVDVCEGAAAVADALIQSGGGIATRFELVDGLAFQSVNCSRSLSTIIYAEVKNGRPRTSLVHHDSVFTHPRPG